MITSRAVLFTQPIHISPYSNEIRIKFKDGYYLFLSFEQPFPSNLTIQKLIGRGATKQLKINIYLPDCNEIKHYDNLEYEIDWILIHIVGELAFYKHIREIILYPLPLEPIGLLSLIELPDFIDYLYQINSRKKTRIM